ncbi:alpha/beta hydrolase [Pelosinus fermentans]|uniref:Serine aminopeptidase S33 domain-containing protein n=1 Tax=Pelosinus fermentans JBW45 TaxID=1192197 RepID=I9NRE5_9FIRM|nr:alpha/beta hydrolase [Pelosinus fermentans]AJQ26590.1 hypothetical protein JBW_01238 [Pelosinus fermentans JBW45]
MQVPVQIYAKGRNLAGVIHIPSVRAIGAPIIIMCYGLNGDRVEVHRMSVFAARRAAQLGITFIRFDYSGLGLSDDEFWHSSINTKVEDVLAVIDFVKGCFQTENPTLVLLGFSDGGRVACRIANICKEVSGLAMWNPMFSAMPPILPNSGFVPKFVREPQTREFVYPFFGLWMGSEYVRDINSSMNIEEFNTYDKDKLLIFGGDDLYSKETREQIIRDPSNLTTNVKIISIPGANHLFNRVEWTEQVISKTMEWVLEVGRLKKRMKEELN